MSENLNNTKVIDVVVILSEFNKDIVENLYKGVKKRFSENAVKINEKKVYVPGAFELPFIAKEIQKKDFNNDKKLSFIITLGCVIKGETAHFDYISSACINSIANLNLRSHIPIILGVITAYSKEQAIRRSETNFDNNDNLNIGYNVANAAFKIIDSIKEV
tara:strand:+ start:858 stop:1340 length:483 start_codon:yes stop_codon:yes gene_type:complete